MLIMDVNQFNEEYLVLHEETKKAIKELEDLTGKEVVFKLINKEESNTFFKLKIKLARKIMDNHIIIINQDNIDNKSELNYYIIHEIMHGLRLFNGEESYRKSVKIKSSSLDAFNEKVFFYKPNADLIGLPDEIIKDYTTYMSNNFFLWFTNTAVDARIEMYISQNYPGIAKLQKQAQKKYAKELLAPFEKKNTKLIPNWILLRLQAMNYAYLTKVTPIIGKSWISKANSCMTTELKSLVEKLMIDLETIDNGQVTDIETLNSWAKILEIEDYIYLDDFENIDIYYLFSN